MTTSPQPQPRKPRYSIDERLFELIFNDPSVAPWSGGGWVSEPGSHQELAALFNCDPATIRRAIRRLVSTGRMRVVPIITDQSREGTMYVTDSTAPVPGTPDHRKALSKAMRRLVELQTALRQMRSEVGQAIEALKQLF